MGPIDMRIIGGTLKGLRIEPGKGLPVRPTTDRAKEALFNILNFRLDWAETRALDLFCGTGSMAFEMASRGVASVLCIDQHPKCCMFVKEMAKKHELPIQVHRDNVFRFLQKSGENYDLIFADPPYNDAKLSELPELILAKGLLAPEGLLILEHPSQLRLPDYPQPLEQRKYGQSTFSLYKNT